MMPFRLSPFSPPPPPIRDVAASACHNACPDAPRCGTQKRGAKTMEQNAPHACKMPTDAAAAAAAQECRAPFARLTMPHFVPPPDPRCHHSRRLLNPSSRACRSAPIHPVETAAVRTSVRRMSMQCRPPRPRSRCKKSDAVGPAKEVCAARHAPAAQRKDVCMPYAKCAVARSGGGAICRRSASMRGAPRSGESAAMRVMLPCARPALHRVACLP